MALVPEVTLNNGVRMPQLGLGVWQVGGDEVAAAVRVAIEAGYRSIDTAAAYGNEAGVGEAVRDSGVDRGELFITSKLANADQGYDSTLRAFDATLDRLGLDTLDLYLIHWPMPATDRYVQTWRAFERLYTDGRVRAIGVSNFQPAHVERLLTETSVVPAVNQIELHPRLPQAPLRGLHADKGIATEAWSPLGQGQLLADPVITELAEAHGRTPAQIILRWHLQLGNIVIPKSVTPERIRTNIDAVGFELSAADVDRISALETGERFGPDPDTVG